MYLYYLYSETKFSMILGYVRPLSVPEVGVANYKNPSLSAPNVYTGKYKKINFQ